MHAEVKNAELALVMPTGEAELDESAAPGADEVIALLTGIDRKYRSGQ